MLYACITYVLIGCHVQEPLSTLSDTGKKDWVTQYLEGLVTQYLSSAAWQHCLLGNFLSLTGASLTSKDARLRRNIFIFIGPWSARLPTGIGAA